MAAKALDISDVSRQSTLAKVVTASGIGLHSGRRVDLRLAPAPENHGIVFVRSDLRGRPTVPVEPEGVISSRLCTVLGHDGVRVSTVEHLMAALQGMGVDNALVSLTAEELPIMDGSAAPFVELIVQAGVVKQNSSRTYIRIREPIGVRDGDRTISVQPAKRLEIRCTVDFEHPLVSDQHHDFTMRNGSFRHEIAPARTFGFLKDVDAMKKAGLAQGGSLDNAVVIDRFSVLNPGGLRFADEFVRHKVMDIMGDLALLGSPVLGLIQAHKSGHKLHHELVHSLLQNQSSFERVQLGSDGVAVELPLGPVLPLPGLQSA